MSWTKIISLLYKCVSLTTFQCLFGNLGFLGNPPMFENVQWGHVRKHWFSHRPYMPTKTSFLKLCWKHAPKYPTAPAHSAAPQRCLWLWGSISGILCFLASIWGWGAGMFSKCLEHMHAHVTKKTKVHLKIVFVLSACPQSTVSILSCRVLQS